MASAKGTFVPHVPAIVKLLDKGKGKDEVQKLLVPTPIFDTAP
jgi:hypothetical protein